MARVTVEDCLLVVPNKFELVLLASKRARDIERGAVPSVSKDNDKATIIALREIAEETISIDGLREITKKSLVDNDVQGQDEGLKEEEEETLEIDENELSSFLTTADEDELESEEENEEGELQ